MASFLADIRPLLAEYSVSADTNFCPIGRSLLRVTVRYFHEIFAKDV